jgi:hypothetical protein
MNIDKNHFLGENALKTVPDTEKEHKLKPLKTETDTRRRDPLEKVVWSKGIQQ